jgi:hypothetical protein
MKPERYLSIFSPLQNNSGKKTLKTIGGLPSDMEGSFLKMIKTWLKSVLGLNMSRTIRLGCDGRLLRTLFTVIMLK